MIFGLLKGGLLFILVVLLLLSLLAGNLFLTLNLSITPENVKESIVSESSEIIESIGEEKIDDAIEEYTPVLESHCKNNTEFVFSYENYTLDIPCETILEGNRESIIEEGVEDVVDEVYYQEYSCESFFECVFESDNPTYLISGEAKKSWSKALYYSLVVSLILIGIMLFLVSASNLFIVTGVLFVISSIPFAILDKVLPLFNNSFLQIIPLILSGASTVFVLSFALGLFLVGVGIAIKFFSLGSFVVSLFGRG